MKGKTLSESIQEPSKFYYYPGVTCEFKYSRTTNVDKVYDMFLSGKLTRRHAFILQAVALLAHATCQMVLQMLTIQRQAYPEKEIPTVNRYDSLMNELIYLSKNGLLACQDYVTLQKNVILVYSCTNQGYNFFRNQLEATMSYDTNSLFRAEHEKFKRLAASSVALALTLGKKTKSLYVNGRSVFGTQKKAEGYTYAGVVYEDELSEQIMFVEPIYFSVDTSITTIEEELKKLEDRLDKLEKVYYSYKTAEINIKYVFCVEHLDGLKKFIMMIKGRWCEMYENAIYTSENVMYDFNYDLNKSFLGYNNISNRLDALRDGWCK